MNWTKEDKNGIAVGDYVFITGHHRISEEMWKKIYPQNIFGKIIETRQRYSQFDGRKLPIKFVIRARAKGEKVHLERTIKYLKKYEIQNKNNN